MMITFTFDQPFNLQKTFECGQIFRFKTFDNGKTYYGTLKGKIVKFIQHSDNELSVDTSLERDVLEEFLRSNDDYNSILRNIQTHPIMREIVPIGNGLRLLKQDLFECTISYFLSQCSNIPRITSNLDTLAMNYGNKIEYDGRVLYTFPTKEELEDITEEKMREMKFGYRAKYIAEFLHNYPSWFDNPQRSGNDLNKKLQSLQGIGQKVADCIQLFGYGDLSCFPVDTWIRKFMIQYFNEGKKMTNVNIRRLGEKMFGKYAGYAQEFMFYWIRTKKS